MLKHMRQHAKYFYFLFFIIILSFIFWGVGGIDKGSNTEALAKIGDETINLQDYWRSYEAMEDLYRDVYSGDFDPEAMGLKKIVLQKLVDERLLLVAAREAGVTVTDAELQEAIVSNPAFQSEGRFDKRVYENRLAINHLSPAVYEAQKRDELMITKMRSIVEDTVELSPEEVEALSGGGDAFTSLRETLLNTKRSEALRSFINAMRLKVHVEVNEQLIS